MKRKVLIAAVLFLMAATVPFQGTAAGPFETKLPKEQQAFHALSRLGFGPRPGDIEEVRKMGVEKWIELQLNPERIPENPVLETRLKPLETLTMDVAQIVQAATPQQMQMSAVLRQVSLNQLLPQDDMRKVMTGTAEERVAVLKALDPDKRRQVLVQVSPTVLASTPEYQKEADEARRAQQAEVQREARRRNPPLQDLLNPDQINTVNRGNREQIMALFEFLEPAKRQQVAAALPPQALVDFPELRREMLRTRQPMNLAIGDVREGKVFRALYSNRQLEEVLVDFWFNHFNVYEAKNVQQLNLPVRTLLTGFERDAIRPHVLGHFKDMLLATARHPAMLFYLDNWASQVPAPTDTGPAAVGPQGVRLPFGQSRGLNENYGRELMELHTLGVDGGYTQADVIAVARSFTGWTIRQPNVAPEFAFASFMHDFGEKTVLGRKVPAGGGEQDGLFVIELLANHPSTAKFISKKLAQRFVADNPPQALIDRMAETFRKTRGDLRAVMATMLTSNEFFSEGAWQSKIKSPLEFVASSVRAVGAEITDTSTLAQKISDLGQPLYGKLEPTGYSNNGDVWLNTAGLTGRLNFAAALASGQIPGVKVDGSQWTGMESNAMARALLGRDLPPATQEAIRVQTLTPRMLASIILSVPEFQRR